MSQSLDRDGRWVSGRVMDLSQLNVIPLHTKVGIRRCAIIPEKLLCQVVGIDVVAIDFLIIFITRDITAFFLHIDSHDACFVSMG